MTLSAFVTGLLQTILTLSPVFLPPFIAFLVFWTNKAMQKTPVAARPIVANAVATAVAAVEQTAHDQLSDPGKKQLAIEKVQLALDHYGIKVPQSLVSDLIEEAVAALPAVGAAITPVPVMVVENNKVGQVPMSKLVEAPRA